MTAPLPDDAAEQLRDAINRAAATPAAATLLGLPNLPNLSFDGPLLGKATETLDEVIGALDLILKYKFLIPDQYEPALTGLHGALTKVRGWLK